ncbi:hypothetical protein IFM89_013881 [Coptis chinensis]|uniref:Protein kinase domain-containing protein n=1 Tax=Coptis chinensis TaxID=261450 RepID=A0A835HH89_9MAGN|nr:hypothetical protein IFM89_013881 [Coptis chinensis]
MVHLWRHVPAATRVMEFPVGQEHYELYEEIGKGGAATVYRALCKPLKETVAIKILDFDHEDPDKVAKEVRLMKLVDHVNVLKAHCAFVIGNDLWVVMPFMEAGSFQHILKTAYKDGLRDEAVICTVLYEALKGLEYLHGQGCIHRDVKAGNILVDSHGAIKLGDLGVSASLFDSGDRRPKRNTITGTPCWMAPEILDMEEGHGYDFKADIWSFGITAIELAHGHAPFSEYPPVKLFLTILTEDPPRLDDIKDQKFSKQFKQMIAKCLVKDPSKRPSATALLRDRFFKNHKSNCVRALVEKIPSIVGKIPKTVKVNVEHMQAPSNIQDVQKEEISHNQYERGVSNWNFDIEELKAQAALIEDEEESFSAEAFSENGDQGDKDINGRNLQQNGRSINVISKNADLDKLLGFHTWCSKGVAVMSC